MLMIVLLVLMALFVAYSNGANDNFKGVATLYGADVADYRTALLVATVATFCGCLASLFLAEGLVQTFSGRGLVPDATAASPIFVLSVATGAGLTIILATVLGFPISTTHGLTGALVGAGYMAAGDQLNLGTLESAFFLPLLASPLLAMLVTAPKYKLARLVVQWLGITKHTCVCITPGQFIRVADLRVIDNSLNSCRGDCASDSAATLSVPEPLISTGTAPVCMDKYAGRVLGITAQSIVDNTHYVSAAAVSFARGLNDTPKIVALLLVVKALDLKIAMLAVAFVMAIGGWLNVRKVAVTMSKRISRMNDGQALIANLVTAFMVIVASRLGLPVSTTHVSVGSITGIGLINGTANVAVVGGIALSWLLTLPIAAAIGAISYLGYTATL